MAKTKTRREEELEYYLREAATQIRYLRSKLTDAAQRFTKPTTDETLRLIDSVLNDA